MKKYKLLCISFLTVFCLQAQTNFDPDDYNAYRSSVKAMTRADLFEKYPAQTIYYSGRETPSSFENFKYLDSIDMVFNLSDDEKKMISNNHFMVSERLSKSSFADAIIDIYSSDLPLFISSDLVLHALHTSYDKMLQRIEYDLLQTNLSVLLSAVRNEIDAVYAENNTIPEMRQAVEDVDLFIAVALSLLNDEAIVPKYNNSGNYDLLLQEINKAQPGLIEIALFSQHLRKFDASQFTPRGHYTESFYVDGKEDNLKNYFKSMMWLGRADFFLTPPPVAENEAPWSEEDILRMNMGAVLMNDLVKRSGKADLLQLHEKIIGFFVGPPDNLSPEELNKILEQKEIVAKDLLNENIYQDFQKEIRSSDDYGQKIMSNFFIVDADKENPAELPISYKFLGQKFIVDSYIFSQLVYDRIYYNGTEVHRMMPDPLDIMFVLGNEDALPLLEKKLDEYNYAYKMEELKYLTNAYDDEFWNQSLYNIWLKAIKQLNPPSDKTEFPFFMQTAAWQVEKLNTQLASWTELRHDNILYAKQSYTGGTSCSFPHVYVEPYPGLYDVLYDFTQSASEFFTEELKDIDIDMKSDLLNYYQVFGEHMLKMKTLSEKELNKLFFTNDEISYLKRFVNSTMSSGPDITGWYTELFFDQGLSTNDYGNPGLKEDYLVVDVHTQPTDVAGNIVGNVLHTGTGDINLGVFCAGSPSASFQPMAFVGPVMSYHEHITSDWKRLNDEEWRNMFWDDDTKPSRPLWASQYLCDRNGNHKENTIQPTLKGVLYEGSSLGFGETDNNIVYLFAFPNPVGESGNLRFILNRTADMSIEIFDGLGRKVLIKNYENLSAGEHNLDLNLNTLAKGLYFVKAESEQGRKVLKLIKE